jgi:NADH-quinone oxidoreductase subunit A
MTAMMIENYIPIFLMIGCAVCFGVFMGRINEWMGPRRPNEQKTTTYESGMEPVRSARDRFSVKFYLVAMLFIVFDIEIVFLYPWAVTFRNLGLQGFIVMFLFIFILLIGFYYAWRKGALDWD